jgi:hypothetical protein
VVSNNFMKRTCPLPVLYDAKESSCMQLDSFQRIKLHAT